MSDAVPTFDLEAFIQTDRLVLIITIAEVIPYAEVPRRSKEPQMNHGRFERCQPQAGGDLKVLNLAETMLINGIEHTTSESNEVAQFCATAKELVNKIGWLADMAAEKLGGMSYKDAEGWLLPPSYKWVDEKDKLGD